MVLFKEGRCELVLTMLANPDDYRRPHREFLWLQKLVAWRALEEKPANLEAEMIDHYEEATFGKLLPNIASAGVNGYYKAIGRYLMV